MGFTMNSLQIETVTPDKAREYLGYNYAHNRPLRQQWVKHLAREMSEGRFMPTAEIHIMYCNGEPVLVNGQHTCNAIALYGKPVRATVRKSSTTEHGQVAMMYAFGHDNGVKRTFNDGLGAYNIGAEIDLGPTYTKYLASALQYIRVGFSTTKSSIAPAPLTEILDVLPEWATYARMYWNESSAPAGDLQRIRRGTCKRGVLSVILVTYRYQLPKARQFWEGVISPGILDNDPRWYARRIIEDSIKTSYLAPRYNSPDLVSRLLAKCWNSYFENVPMRQIPSTKKGNVDATSIIRIAGTPYTGKKSTFPWWPDED